MGIVWSAPTRNRPIKVLGSQSVRDNRSMLQVSVRGSEAWLSRGAGEPSVYSLVPCQHVYEMGNAILWVVREYMRVCRTKCVVWPLCGLLKVDV